MKGEIINYIKINYNFGIMFRNWLIISCIGVILIIYVSPYLLFLCFALMILNLFSWLYHIILNISDYTETKNISSQDCKKVAKIINKNIDFSVIYISNSEILISKEILYTEDLSDVAYQLSLSKSTKKIFFNDYKIPNLNEKTIAQLCNYLEKTVNRKIGFKARYYTGTTDIYYGKVSFNKNGTVTSSLFPSVESETVLLGYIIYPLA